MILSLRWNQRGFTYISSICLSPLVEPLSCTQAVVKFQTSLNGKHDQIPQQCRNVVTVCFVSATQRGFENLESRWQSMVLDSATNTFLLYSTPCGSAAIYCLRPSSHRGVCSAHFYAAVTMFGALLRACCRACQERFGLLLVVCRTFTSRNRRKAVTLASAYFKALPACSGSKTWCLA